MAGRGARPRRPPANNGQHFLPAPLARAIVRNACVTSADVVVDLGAGRGALTRELAARAASVIAVEMDESLAAGLRALASDWRSVTVRHGDALTVPLPRDRYRVVANLPFGAATRIIDRLLGDPLLQRADVVVQWEAALDLAAQRPGSLRSLLWAPWWEVSISRRIPGAAYRPPASVATGVMSITRRPDPLLPASRRDAYAAMLRSAFGSGRDVRSWLRSVGQAPGAVAGVAGTDLRVPPRDLDAAQWTAIARWAAIARAVSPGQGTGRP